MLPNILFYLEKSLRKAIDEQQYDYLCTMENSNEHTHWLQVKYNCINMYHPFSEAPVTKLSDLKIEFQSDLKIIDWQPALYITLQHYATNHYQLIPIKYFIERYIENVMNIHDNADWKIVEE